MALTLRQVRRRAAWLLVVPFLWWSRPTLGALMVGLVITAAGLLIRAWSAGTIQKDERLTTSGPYSFTRNPLYLGSLFVGLGVTIAGGQWFWPVVFVVYYVAVYVPTMVGEHRHLGRLFPGQYGDYAAAVPGFLPGFRRYRQEPPPGRSGEPEPAATAHHIGFLWSRYRRNREWEALLGVVAALATLAAKVVLL